MALEERYLIGHLGMKSETEKIPKILVKVVEKDWSGSGQKHATDGSKNEVNQKAKDQQVMQIQVIAHAKDRQTHPR